MPELEEITPEKVGELSHLINDMTRLAKVMTVHAVLAEVYGGFAGAAYRAEADRRRQLWEEAEIDVRMAGQAWLDWMERHLPPGVCPHGPDSPCNQPPDERDLGN